MYETYPAFNEHGIAVVWHMKAKQSTEALCGHVLIERIERIERNNGTNTMQAETVPHCRPCMTSFAQLVNQDS
ncbi:hypothetical protein [Streptomyces bicolor]|uniref:hypothetical protein n=1 Tax=Streptomyces bicolor TaxID=66874 RepID=UPI0004E22097|nr:hypothetical protein [Streptomyces bicolor]